MTITGKIHFHYFPLTVRYFPYLSNAKTNQRKIVGNKAKSESQNRGNKKAKHAKFSKNEHFLPPDTYLFLYPLQTSENIRYALIPYYRRIIYEKCNHNFMIWKNWNVTSNTDNFSEHFVQTLCTLPTFLTYPRSISF